MKWSALLMTVLVLAVREGTAQETLPAKLLAVTIDHIRAAGPDEDAAQFIATAPFSWEKRNEIAQVTTPFLTNQLPAKVAGALAVLYRLRAYRPMEDLIGVGGSAWEQKYKPAPFWSELDRAVFAGIPHFHTLNDAHVFHNLSLYLGVVPSADSGGELLRIATETTEKEQALICLAWHRDPKDMEFLFPFMMADTSAARSLPYHFRNSYGVLATPYLKRALTEAKAAKTRMEAAFELVRLGEIEGFDCLLHLVSENPRPSDKSPTVIENIQQYARDYLAMPSTVLAPEDIASYLQRKRAELIQSKKESEKGSNNRLQAIGAKARLQPEP